MATTIQRYPLNHLFPAFDQACVADVIRLGVISCPANTPLEQVAETMATQRVHAVVVAGTRIDPVHGEQLVWGFLSDRDLVHAARAGDIKGVQAGDVASTEAPTVDVRTPLAEALRIMDEHSVSHLVVVAAGQPVAVVSTLDLAGALARSAA
jgi:CBS domain-containing protein